VNMIFLGPPGAGKGTQARKVTDKYGYPQISTGDILRDAIKNGTELGKKAKSFMDAGQLVPDDIVIHIVAERLAKPDCGKGFILDGFPRNSTQAEVLAAILIGRDQTIDIVIDFSVEEEALIKRLVERMICKKCGMSYNITFSPPKKQGTCDKCGGELYKRDDDNEKTARERYKVYREQSQELSAFYSSEGRYAKLDGFGDIEGIFKQVEEIIGEK
jgi:adenylate kinase